MGREITFLDAMKATVYWIQAAYHLAALNHVGHTHPDAAHLTRKYLTAIKRRDDLITP